MALGSEAGSVQRPFVRYAVAAGWTYLSPEQALALRAGGVTSPVLDRVLVGQLPKLNPGIVDAARAAEVVKRLVRVRPKAVQVRRMKRKWGSCSTTGRVTFNADLLRQHPEFRRRVIVEELLHLRVPNHGKLFRTLLQAYLGGASLRES